MSILPQWNVKIQNLMECYNISREPEDDDPQDIHIAEFEGNRALKEPGLSSEKFLKPLKIKKVNIGSLENPKFANIGVTGMMKLSGKSLIYYMNSKTYSRPSLQK